MPPAPATPPATPTILAVDDDEGLLLLTEAALRREKWNVATARSGAEALAWLGQNNADLLLLDLRLPDTEGREFIGALAEAGHSLPFIIITGQGDERVAVDMMKRGALDYLIKSINFVELLPVVVRGAFERLEQERRLAAAEKAGLESAERYRLLAETAGTVILLLGRDGAILEWSGEAERTYGLTATEAVGKNYLTLCLREDDRPGVARQLESIHRGLPTKGYENRVLNRQGEASTFVWNASLLQDPAGHPIGALSVGHDITPRKLVEEALQRSQANLDKAQALAHLGSYEIDLSGPLHLWSEEATRITGVNPLATPASALTALTQLVHPEDQPRVRKTVEAALARGQNFDLQCRILRVDGRVRFVHVIGEPVRDALEHVGRIVGTLHDVTERKELEQEILAISEREQRRFGQDLHDGLGQHLTVVDLFCHTFREDLRAQAPELIKPFKKLCEVLREITRETRTLARGLSPVALEADGLMNGLRELARSTRRLARVDCRFHCRPPALMPDTTAAMHLYRIAQEAVNNALKHSAATRIRVSLTDRGDRIELKVRDNGCGLPVNAPRGDGMGLRVMRHRAELIGAELSVDSAPRAGVRITCIVRKPS